MNGRLPGRPGSTIGDAALVLEDVAVDVAEAGHVDRQLAAQDAGGDLGDLVARRLLLLAPGAIGHLVEGTSRPDGVSASGDSVVTLAAVGPVRGRLGARVAAAVVDPATAARRPAGARPVAVVVPARDEAAALPHLLAALVAPAAAAATSSSSSTTTRPTARPPSPRRSGRAVVAGPGAARRMGRQAARLLDRRRGDDGAVLVFLDADVRPGPHLLDGLGRGARRRPGAVVSVQPWHDAVRPGERLSVLANVVALMGSGGVHGARPHGCRPTWRSGPCSPSTGPTYERAGGHAHPSVRASLTEDIELARGVGRSRLFSDRRDATFRMYPAGSASCRRVVAHDRRRHRGDPLVARPRRGRRGCGRWPAGCSPAGWPTR